MPTSKRMTSVATAATAIIFGSVTAVLMHTQIRTSQLSGVRGVETNPIVGANVGDDGQSAALSDEERLTLRLDWTDLPPMSEMAKRIHHSQTSVDVRLYKKHVHFEAGLGSNLHTWAQSLCHAVENDLTLLTRGPWKWMDGKSCPAVDKGVTDGSGNPMRCYFGAHVDGGTGVSSSPQGEEIAFASESVPASETMSCPSIQGVGEGMYSVGEWMEAATEFLFQSLDPAVISEAERQVRAVFPQGLPHPDDLVTVNVRWGDKGSEMPLQPIWAYMRAVRDLVRTRPKERAHFPVHVYLATEDPEALKRFMEAAGRENPPWRVHSSGPLQDRKDNNMWTFASGRRGLESMAALLISMEANRYVLTTGSNWSRLINELRNGVVNPRCNNCTEMVDLYYGESPKMQPDGTVVW
uniref:Uncharacterized protein n=1 Tax=Trieres chinensis TaxID=1514140 RepID=A0A7S1ZA53_TRICV